MHIATNHFVGYLLLIFTGKCHIDARVPLNSNEINGPVSNSRPIIGILTETPPADLGKQYTMMQSVLHQAYVGFIEMAGARVAPILKNRDDKYYQDKFNSVNGLVLQGEVGSLNDKSFHDAATTLLQMASAANDKQDYFPVLGINAGFAVLANYLAGSNVQTACSSQNVALSLNMTKNYTDSLLFHNIPDDVNLALTTRPVTYNFHNTCLTPQNVISTKLNSLIHVLSTNKDEKGMEFVSTFEAIKYPYFALQWNPERNPFEWSLSENQIPHDYMAIRAVQHVANVFVDEARKNSHTFSGQEEQQSIIYHYKLYYLTNIQTPIQVMFMFQNNTKTHSTQETKSEARTSTNSGSNIRNFLEHYLFAFIVAILNVD